MNTTLFKEIGKLSKTDDLVEGNLKLVVYLAKPYQGMGLSLDDLIHEGTIGLCKAKDRYEEGKGKFSSYAALWIKAYIRQALNNKSRVIRVPAHKTHLTDEHPAICQLDVSYQGGYESKIDDKYTEIDNIKKIKNLLSKLKPNQNKIIKMKFGIGLDEEMKTADIAKEMNMSVQAVNGNIRNGLKSMKSYL